MVVFGNRYDENDDPSSSSSTECASKPLDHRQSPRNWFATLPKMHSRRRTRKKNDITVQGTTHHMRVLYIANKAASPKQKGGASPNKNHTERQLPPTLPLPVSSTNTHTQTHTHTHTHTTITTTKTYLEERNCRVSLRDAHKGSTTNGTNRDNSS